MAAESLLLPVVCGVARKASHVLVQSVTRLWGIDDDRDKLEHQLLAVQSLLADAEVKSKNNPAVRRWMKDLKAVAYKADDILDDFQYEALHRDAQSHQSVSSKVLSYFTSHNRLVFRHKVSRDLKNVLFKIDELVTEMNKFGLTERQEVPHALYRQTHSGLEESTEILGRENDSEVVVKLLLDQHDQQNVQVLPIIGMGGMGKTTLAKMVYNDRRVQKHFDLKMWHCVSENFEATAVVRSVIELATNGRCDLRDTIELLRGKLQEVIGRKRFLLVLDDVWNEEPQKWEDLRPLLCSSVGGSGSMIVVTSRSQQVASIMGTLPLHELACLSEDDSWKLFSKKAFSKGVQEQEDRFMLGRSIVKKCKGLPLALKTMGGLMSSKQEVQEWEAIAKSNVGCTSLGKDEVLSVLNLSYRHLSSEMKQCFTFCAVFPKDYEMEKDMLIQLWMANGFIHEEGTMDLEQKGEFIFKELTWRSFLEDVNVKQFSETVACKMHDLMHDLAKDVTDDCASVEELTQNKASVKDVHHMIVPSCELDEISTLLKGTSSLRTLLIQSRQRDSKGFKLTSLRVFCCVNSSFIHSPLINRTHLRYLDLSESDIARLPNSLCVLYNLQSLRLNECRRLRYLPEGITNLRKLNHLYLLGCDNLQRMPPNLSKLHNLRTLTTFVVNTGDGFGIEELKDLQKVGYLLELYNLRKVKSWSNANLQEKHKLSELRLYWGRDQVYSSLNDEVSNNEEEVLESFVPHGKLKILEVHGYGGHVISRWMRNPQIFQCLRALRISNCPRCKDLPVVWLSSSLEHLYLSYMDSLTTLCKNICVEAEAYNTSLQIFPKLKIMELSDLPKLEKWVKNNAGEPDSSVMFPQLEELIIRNCNKLATLPVSPVLKLLSCHSDSAEIQISMSMPLESWPSLVILDIGLLADLVMPLEDHQSLRSLKIVGDSSFVSIFNLSKLQQGLRDCLVFTEELDISNCNSIVCWPVEELRCLPLLRSLTISCCRNLEGTCSPSEEILALPQLKRLYIHFCHSLLEIPQLPASLVEVEICWCKSLISLPSNLGNLAKLSLLRLHSCQGLETLPDVMDGLTSFEVLTILRCPGIVKLPQGLLQQFQAIKCLQIEGCPELQRRCRQGGEYFDLVSSNPRKHIPAAESKSEKSLKRFLRHY